MIYILQMAVMPSAISREVFSMVCGWNVAKVSSDKSEAILWSYSDCTNLRCFGVSQFSPVNIRNVFPVAVASLHMETESPVTMILSAQARNPR